MNYQELKQKHNNEVNKFLGCKNAEKLNGFEEMMQVLYYKMQAAVAKVEGRAE